MNRTRSNAAGLLLAAAMTTANAASEPVPVLVELFTSEGCSSCPPADRVLADLVQRQPVAGVRVIGLGEHVDYWDGLGWRDPFASPAFTSRQQGYAGRIHSGGAFTPEMVIDGQSSRIGSQRNEVIDAIQQRAADPKLPVSLSWSADVPRRLSIRIQGGLGAAQVWLATTQSGVVSKVLRGENSGSTLEHVAVTRGLRVIGSLGVGQAFEEAVDVTWPDTLARSKGVVVFVQDPASRRVLGSAALDG